MKKGITGIIILTFLFLGMPVLAAPKKAAKPPAQKTYVFDRGISFSYPSSYTAKLAPKDVLSASEYVELFKGKNKDSDIVVSLNSVSPEFDYMDADLEVLDPKKITFGKFVELYGNYSITCSADGPTGSISCDDEKMKKSMKKLTSKKGLKGYTYTVHQINEDYGKNGKASKTTKKIPVTALDVSKYYDDGYVHALFIGPNGETFKSATSALKKDMQSIADSVLLAIKDYTYTSDGKKIFSFSYPASFKMKEDLHFVDSVRKCYVGSPTEIGLEGLEDVGLTTVVQKKPVKLTIRDYGFIVLLQTENGTELQLVHSDSDLVPSDESRQPGTNENKSEEIHKGCISDFEKIAKSFKFH